MLPLPSVKFEVRRTATANVGKDGFVRSSLDHYYYSVPHEYIGNRVILKIGSKQTFKRQAESVVLLAFKDSPCAVRN